MARIKGNVIPPQMGIDAFQKSLALGRWALEYRVAKDNTIISKGVFKSTLEGQYDIGIEAQNNSTVFVKCLGSMTYETAEISMPISSRDSVVYCSTLHMEPK
jgi:hypothetical protein